ncbi:hypothetical protein GII36_03270 [Candidatus Mycosynbacter amalyticus]|uniref:Uncharacterized protein n=1 Tax=Candidatus Mycosynbacter amalyticus TaxID=2665156 RepID=A0A857MQF7_9BACT|nr:hypothetical protein [Candidatus Mycosynbacter amalyticus]QHN42860.1 hypothetical protein GII36_03270 [Candidatus Mycosynbacter amalyticus]
MSLICKSRQSTVTVEEITWAMLNQVRHAEDSGKQLLDITPIHDTEPFDDAKSTNSAA